GDMKFERIPDRLAVPDWKVGNNTVHLYTDGHNLPAIAEKMFTEGNPNFVVAYVIHDGLVKQDEAYDVMYKNGKVSWQGKTMPGPMQTKYSKLMADFLKAHGKDMQEYGIGGNGVTKKELNNPQSAIRKKRIF